MVVNSILRASEILKVVSEEEHKLNAISLKTNLSKATAHRILKTLISSGLVFEDPSKREYYLGPLVVKLASNPLVMHKKIITCAMDEMRRLWDLTKETVSIQIVIGDRRMILHEIQSPHAFRFAYGNGTTLPLHGGAGGKILLAELPESELTNIMQGLTLRQYTANTITDLNKLFQEIDKVRNEGFATSISEIDDGGISMAVPIKNYICPVALSVGGPIKRLDNIDIVKKNLQVSARLIANKVLENGS